MEKPTPNMMNIQTARRALLEKHFSTSQNAKFVEQVSTKIQTTKQVYHAHPVLEPTLPTMAKPPQNMMNFQTAKRVQSATKLLAQTQPSAMSVGTANTKIRLV